MKIDEPDTPYAPPMQGDDLPELDLGGSRFSTSTRHLNHKQRLKLHPANLKKTICFLKVITKRRAKRKRKNLVGLPMLTFAQLTPSPR